MISFTFLYTFYLLWIEFCVRYKLRHDFEYLKKRLFFQVVMIWYSVKNKYLSFHTDCDWIIICFSYFIWCWKKANLLFLFLIGMIILISVWYSILNLNSIKLSCKIRIIIRNQIKNVGYQYDFLQVQHNRIGIIIYERKNNQE